MATLQERQPVERTGSEQNSFLRFVVENNDLFGKYSSLTYELRDEEEGWRNSPTIADFAERYFELALNSVPSSVKQDSNRTRRVRGRMRDFVMDRIFKQNGSEKPIDLRDPVLSRLTPDKRAAAERLGGEIEEFKKGFRETRNPIADELRKTKADLTEKFRDFLLSDPSGIFMFQEFLSRKDIGRKRDEIRHSLSSFADNEELMSKRGEGTILSQAVKKWTTEFKERPTGNLIDEFVPSIKESAVLAWLQFMFPMPIKSTVTSQEEGEWRTHIASYLKDCSISTWPFQLKGLLSSFIGSKYQLASDAVRKELKQFTRPATISLKELNRSFGAFEDEIDTMEVEVTPKKTDNNKPALALVRTEKVERRKHPVGILSRDMRKPYSVRPSTQDELEAFLRKASDSLDPSDPRMLEDLKKIISDLSESPYGPNIKNLHPKISIGTHTVPLRSYNPGKKIGLDLRHPESKNIRIVFTRSEQEDGLPIVGLEGIYKHEDYENKFA